MTWWHAEFEPWLTTATGHCHNNFNQWKCRFLWKLCYQWLKGLRHHQIAILRRDPGHQHAWYWPCLKSCEVKWDCHLYGWLLISSLLMTRWHTEPGHQQAWYWLSLRVVLWSEIVTCMDGYWYQACWWPGDILSQVISRLDIDLVSELWSEVRLSLVWTVTDIKPADDLVTYWARSSAGLILT